MGSSHFDTFVAAWFHPDGVHSMPVSTSTHPLDLPGNNDSGNNDDNNSNYHVPANEPVRRVREAVFEWRGYRHASQVLVPFGYATSFLDSVVEPISQSYTSDDYALVLRPKMIAFCQDDCFLSGLKRRCEFSHMYPQSERNNLIVMSPVCIAIDAIKTTRRNSNPEDSGDEKEKTEADAGEDDEGASWTIRSVILHPSLQV